MKLIRPTAISAAVLSLTNVTESVAAWSAATTYGASATARSDTTKRIYQSLAGGNLNHNPVTDVDPATGIGTYWQDIGPTNARAMFDDYNQTQTAQANKIEVTLAPSGIINAAALLNLDAASVTVVMTDATAGEVFNETFDLVSTDNVGADFYAWAFEPIIRRTDLHVDGLPAYSSPTIKFTIDNTGGTAKCGNLVIGQQRELGVTVEGAGFGIIDHSRKEADDFGNFSIVERSYRKTGTFEVMVDRQMVDEVGRLLALYRATPVVWIGTGEFASAIYFGFYRDFRVVVESYPQSKLTIEIEGLS